MKSDGPLPWLRLYVEILDDSKVQLLPDKLFKFWINCLCIARKYDGWLPDPGSIAFILRLKKKVVVSQLAGLANAGLLDSEEKGYAPHSWARRQYKSDNSTERVNRFRDARRNVTCNVARNVGCNGDETALRIQSTEAEETPPSPSRGSGGGGALFRKKQDEWFDRFYLAYWRKVGKDAALAKFRLKIRDEATFNSVMAAVKKQTPEMMVQMGVDKKKVPHPATWINQGRWKDEDDQEAAASSGPAYRPADGYLEDLFRNPNE